MNTSVITLVAVAVSLVAVAAATVVPGESAMAHAPSVTITSVSDEISVQKTAVVLSVPPDNELPWGFVTGQASDHMPEYPVIVQFHQDGEPVHFAQVEANADGSYEYRFRVLSVDLETGQTTHIFQGEYDVSIFTVVPSTQPHDPVRAGNAV